MGQCSDLYPIELSPQLGYCIYMDGLNKGYMMIKMLSGLVFCCLPVLGFGSQVLGDCPNVKQVSDYVKSQNVSDCRFRPPFLFTQSQYACRAKIPASPIIAFLFTSSAKTKQTASSESKTDSAELQPGKPIKHLCVYQSRLCKNSSCQYTIIY